MGIKNTNSEIENQKAEGLAVVGKETTADVAVSTKKPNKKSGSLEEFKNQGKSVREAYTEEEKRLEGSKSHVIGFEVALGNPARPQKRMEGGVQRSSYQCVGYVLKTSEDIMVPVAPLKQGARHEMDFDEVTWKPVKAGEKFQVTLAEAGILISQIEYGGKFTMDGDEIVLHATISPNRGGVPLTVLKRPNAPLKDSMVVIADAEVGENGKKTYKVKPEYAEKFGYIFNRTRTSSGSTAERGKKDNTENLAAAFRNLMGSRIAK